MLDAAARACRSRGRVERSACRTARFGAVPLAGFWSGRHSIVERSTRAHVARPPIAASRAPWIDRCETMPGCRTRRRVAWSDVVVERPVRSRSRTVIGVETARGCLFRMPRPRNHRRPSERAPSLPERLGASRQLSRWRADASTARPTALAATLDRAEQWIATRSRRRALRANRSCVQLGGSRRCALGCHAVSTCTDLFDPFVELGGRKHASARTRPDADSVAKPRRRSRRARLPMNVGSSDRHAGPRTNRNARHRIDTIRFRVPATTIS